MLNQDGKRMKTHNQTTQDFLIVGAGILGLTVAWELKKRFPRASVAILEKESGPGLHASGRNSGVLHSGIYYPKNTLKAQVCSRGSMLMRAFAKEEGIPCERRGKVIIPTSQSELPTLDRLFLNARDNGIEAECLDAADIRKIEPYAAPYEKGIHIPDIYVIDGKAVTRKLHELLESRGVRFYWDHRVTHLDDAARSVSSIDRHFGYGMLFNCAGAYSEAIAKQCGLGGSYAMVPFKGIYFKLRPESADLVRGNIYPVPDLSMPFLGVHLTRGISGDVYIGPSSIPALGREHYYGVLHTSEPAETLRIVRLLVDLYMADNQNFRKMVYSEGQKLLRRHFLNAARRLVPKITEDDVVKTLKRGIRPQLVDIQKKSLVMDYVLEKTETSVHVLNAISPAFTSSFEFAKFIVDQSPLASSNRKDL